MATKYFIKLNGSLHSYEQLCFEYTYDTNEKIGNLIYRQIKSQVKKNESLFLKNIHFEFVVITDETKGFEILNFFNERVNSSFITEIEGKYVIENTLYLKNLLLPKYYKILAGFSSIKYYYVHIFCNEDEYDYMYYRNKYGSEISHYIKIYCDLELGIKLIHNGKYLKERKDFLEEYVIEISTGSDITELYDNSKMGNYINFKLEDILKILNKSNVRKAKK